MAKDTGVPKLKGQSNCRQWYIRLKAYMMDKGSWDAVRFVPYKKGDSQRVSPTPSPETAQTGSASTSDSTFDSSQDKPETHAHYAELDYDFGTADTEIELWTYHPKNDCAINHILQHCEDTPANKIEGVEAARDAMNMLLEHYAVSSELEKYLVVKKLWATTYASAGDMTTYTDRFADTWKDINCLQIDLEF
ncbi:hypothetical protein K402DRAFT_263188 [Aulographum hederae CBS 113979]|uniref:DUF4219 domain-containing protein n=1 Tax=Aulographum hederae CBS 113979 TaxID=1176131 RepID=A0A6G1H9M9_9PEZI|nr:hypothetical protein K402DRAFT_263188 [Aulographum hederae CBS 113979]